VEGFGGGQPGITGCFRPTIARRGKGWLTAYFDVLSRVSRSEQAYSRTSIDCGFSTKLCELQILRLARQSVRSDRLLRCCFWLPGCSASPAANRLFLEISRFGMRFFCRRTTHTWCVSGAGITTA